MTPHTFVSSGNGGGDAKNVGVGAKVGFSTASDLANRIEQAKELLPWDEMSLADQQSRLEEEERNRKNHEEQFRQEQEQRLRQEREQQVQLRNEQMAQESRQKDLIVQTFASSGLTVTLDSSPSAEISHGHAEGEEDDLHHSSVDQGYAMASSPTDTGVQDDFHVDQSTEIYVSVQGVKKLLSELTDDDLDLMDEDEFSRYSSLV